MWIRIILFLGASSSGLLLAAGLLDAWRRRKRLHAAIRLFLSTPAGRRSEALRAHLKHAPTDGPAWYLLGCTCLRAHRTREAARAFGLAHHCDCNLETAVLLTFACLKAGEGDDTDIIEQIRVTWEELGRPNPDHRAEDRKMLACLASTRQCRPGGTVDQGMRNPTSPPPLERLIRLVTEPAPQSRIPAQPA